MSQKRKRFESPHAARARARKRALQALYQWEITRADASDIFQQFVEEQDMAKVDVEYFKRLLTHVVARHEQLDNALSEFMDRAPAEADLLELATLRLGAYELMEVIEIPYKVVINEAVNLAAQFGSDQSPTYVNAVLDKAAGKWREIEVQAAASTR